jgi:hypothetical protein
VGGRGGKEVRGERENGKERKNDRGREEERTQQHCTLNVIKTSRFQIF